MKRTLLLSGLALTSVFIAPMAQAEDILTLLSQARDQPARIAPDTIPYRYTLALSVANIEGKEKSAAQAVLRIDPSQPPGQRAVVVSADNPDAKALADFFAEVESPDNTMEKQAQGFWCGPNAEDQTSLAELDPASFTIISDGPTEAVIQPDMVVLAELLMQSGGPEDKGGERMMRRLMKRLEGEVTLSKPDVEMTGFRVRMTRSMTMMVVAKLKEMEAAQTCALAPNGHYHIETMTMRVQGKALGTAFGQNMDMRISALTPLP